MYDILILFVNYLMVLLFPSCISLKIYQNYLKSHPFPSPGARPIDVGWLRNGHDIPDSEEFRYVTRGFVHQLEIAEIFPEDSGKYTCEALNDHGEADSSAMVNVLGK